MEIHTESRWSLVCSRLFAVSPELMRRSLRRSPFDNYPGACGLHSDPVLTVDGGTCKGHANKPRTHTFNSVMSCVCLLSGVFELAVDTFVLGLAVVWLIDVSTKEWLRSDGQALAREERTPDTLYLQPSGPQRVQHLGPVQYGSMFDRLA